ncbi:MULTISPECIES: ATP-binding protein [Chitinophaga]|uniref:ATP-binding protein n=1 Tax=Chitinophaga TaxID=79328 RepID=UPI000DB9821D|nr:ATP-binding protein [Chitinophaga ginsengisegetis]MDR6569825.1 signal transduction histidine kinase [Chitinophaga ginsengisegetis]MDR6649558.1 signal transduction histidine kinase [Chitinophaga ginsengisegetis]MDR6655908.1 signal transduction histidine kinase [Chitinophaga ginsengisegetis]
MEPITAIQLKSIPALKEVPLEQLQWLISQSEEKLVPEGELMFKAGDPVIATIIVISGKVRISATINGHYREIVELNDDNITGWLPFSRVKTAMGNGLCLKDTRILICPAEKIKAHIEQHYELTEALVHIMTSRVRETTSSQQQNEKMMALGKLSAGLAHELNNPVAAICRSSDKLFENISHIPAIFKEMAALCLSQEQATAIVDNLQQWWSNKPSKAPSLLELSDKTTAIEDWLENKNISRIEIAEILAEYGVETTTLDDFSRKFDPAHLDVIFSWIHGALEANRMVGDLQISSKRISDLVSAVKRYTYMDQEPDKQFIDIHSGISNTLIMLDYRLKKGNVELVENFDTSLPKIKALPGELNQVWTNLVDNALDAMEPAKKGRLEIATTKDRQCVHVTITDNGPGIPEEIQSRIFEPFFTTKDLGKGTGLGLDVVAQIVQRHRGSVKQTSVPGKTIFTISFPIENN